MAGTGIFDLYQLISQDQLENNGNQMTDTVNTIFIPYALNHKIANASATIDYPTMFAAFIGGVLEYEVEYHFSVYSMHE